jgi:hypothetical protein
MNSSVVTDVELTAFRHAFADGLIVRKRLEWSTQQQRAAPASGNTTTVPCVPVVQSAHGSNSHSHVPHTEDRCNVLDYMAKGCDSCGKQTACKEVYSNWDTFKSSSRYEARNMAWMCVLCMSRKIPFSSKTAVPNKGFHDLGLTSINGIKFCIDAGTMHAVRRYSKSSRCTKNAMPMKRESLRRK